MSTSLPRITGSSVNTLVAILVTLGMAIALFLLTNSYTNLVGRLDRLEQQNVMQQEVLSTIQVQLDVINQRGSTGADARLTSLESRLVQDESRLAGHDARILLLESKVSGTR